MKKNKASLSIVLAMITAIGACAFVAGCKDKDKDPAPTEAQRVTALLMAATSGWQPAMVTVDGVDVTDDLFAGFSITFQESTLSTTGTTPVWEHQDTWTFKDESATAIVRGSDGKEVSIISISDTQLKLRLEWDETTYEPGRKASLKGIHEFTLNK